MTYDVIERSNQDGKPVALYEFLFGTIAWRYCAFTSAITVGGNTYEPLAISDGGYSMSGEPADDMISITVDASIPLSNILNGSPPSQTIWVNVRRYHHGDTEAPITWIGYVASRKQMNAASVDIRCKMLTAGFNRDGARLTYGRQCPHVLYGIDCRANKAAFAFTMPVESLAGGTVYSSYLTGQASGYFSNGFFEWVRYTGAVERRGIEFHTGNHFTVLGTTIGIDVGDIITVYPGCQRTRSDCKNKFNNLSNYGGFAHMPNKSPFGGDPVF